jgi:hypothetical protein
MGCALFVPGIYVIRFLLKWETNWWILASLILAFLMQPVLVVIAAKTLMTMFRPPKWRTKFLASLVYGIVLFVLFWLAYSPIPYQLSKNEASAQGHLCLAALEAHSDALAAYEAGHEVYPLSFPNIAPEADPKCKGDSLVVGGLKPEDGYRFEYAGISPLKTAEGCKRFKSFSISARPIAYGRTGFRSFLVDGYQRVHATSEDRPANPSDPIVLWAMDCPRHTPA